MKEPHKLKLRTETGSFVTLEMKPTGVMIGVSVTMSRVGETYVSTLLTEDQTREVLAFLLGQKATGDKGR